MTCDACGAELGTVMVLDRKIELNCPCSSIDYSDRARAIALENLAGVALEASTVPDMFRHVTFGDITPPVVQAVLHRACADLPDFRDSWHEHNIRTRIRSVDVRGRGIGLYGAKGVGKSVAMGVFLRMVRERLIPGVFLPASQLQLEIEDGQRFTSALSAARVVAMYAKAPVLVLDDVDKLVASTSAVAVAVFELIDARYRERRPLYTTMNVTPDELATKVFLRQQRHGEAAEDRLLDMLDWLKFPGEESLRGMAVAQ